MQALRVLLVEDSEDDADLLRTEFKRGGYNPTIFRVQSKVELSAAILQPWDLVISDYNLPTFSAPLALEIVTASMKDLPFIVVSGSIGEERAVGLLKAGAHDFITKDNLARFLPSVERALRDVADRKARRDAEEHLRQVEDQLRQSKRLEAIGQVTANIAHDFNNFLTVINGRCEILNMLPNMQQEVKHEVEMILSAGRRAAELTRQLLVFSRRQVLDPRVFDLNALIADMESMLKTIAGSRVEFQVRLTPQACRIKADPGQISQVLMNLVVNARDAMSDGGRAKIETCIGNLSPEPAEKKPAYAILSVLDSGIGMDRETKSRIFEPFFTTKGPGKGTGLGLSTVYGIVKQSGGEIGVLSEVGKGSEFRIALPYVGD